MRNTVRTFDSPIPRNSSLQYHRTYTYLESLPHKRGTLLRSYLRLLYSTPNPDHKEIVTIQQHYENLLRKITVFPKAGEANLLLLDCLDRMFEGWQLFTENTTSEIDYQDTIRVIEAHYRGIELTFHSHRILRNLTRLHMAISDYKSAVRSLELYIQLWRKAKEADLVNVTRQIRHFRQELLSEKKPTIEKAAAIDSTNSEELDIDTDNSFIEMCCVGAQLYCKFAVEEGSALKGVELIDRALELLGKQSEDEPVDTAKLRAKVKRWQGIARGCLAFKGKVDVLIMRMQAQSAVRVR